MDEWGNVLVVGFSERRKYLGGSSFEDFADFVTLAYDTQGNQFSEHRYAGAARVLDPGNYSGGNALAIGPGGTVYATGSAAADGLNYRGFDFHTVKYFVAVDSDGDGFTSDVDCDDANPAVHPRALELCNGIDDNCNGIIDDDPEGRCTPTGDNIEVQPDQGPVTLTFDEVTSSGATTVPVQGTGEPPPSGFKLGQPPQYYEITTTAEYAGQIRVCTNYGNITFPNQNQEANLRLFHRDAGGAWVDITTSLDTANNVICGMTSSLSPFAVFQANSAPVLISLDVPFEPVCMGQHQRPGQLRVHAHRH